MKIFAKLLVLAMLVCALPVNAELVSLTDSLNNSGEYSSPNDLTPAYAKDIYVVGKVTFVDFNSVDCWNVITLWDSTGGELLSVSQLGNGVNWGMVTGGVGELTSELPIVDSEPMLVVIKMEQVSKAFKVWLNPDLSGPETAPTIEQTSPRGDFTLGGVYFRGGFWGSNPNESKVSYEDFVLYKNESPFNNHAPVTPTPEIGTTRVELTTDLSWNAPVGVDTVGYDVYLWSTDPNDTVGKIKVASDITDTTLANADIVASYGQMLNGIEYNWQVDSYEPNEPGSPIVREGNLWHFFTVPAVVVIDADPISLSTPAGGSAVMSVSDLNGTDYQWYFTNLDNTATVALAESAKYVNVNTNTLTVTDVNMADEGYYYCEVSNSLPSMVASEPARLWVQRVIAYWPFENDSIDSMVDGSPETLVEGAPAFVTEGIVGSALSIAEDVDALYTAIEEASYFDICDQAMTVSCWIKTSNTQTWVPFVARDGEGAGWQLRQSGFTSDRPCFTTRGTGNDDGTPANKAIFDDQWHFVVGTFDGSVKKVYVDGVLSRTYSTDDGSLALEGDEATAPVRATDMPISIAARAYPSDDSFAIDVVNNCPGIYDEVTIYNYALDELTIAHTYADITGENVCLQQTYDLDNDCDVDVNDFALLASEWLNDAIVAPEQE